MPRLVGARVSTAQPRRSLPFYISILIIAQAFTAFMTETKFLPLKHNVGAFEVVSVVFFIVTIWYFAQHGLRLRFHRTMVPLALMAIAAGVSNFGSMSNPSAEVLVRVLSCAILIVSICMLVAWYNVFLLHESTIDLFLKAITWSAAIVASWVLLDQMASGGIVGPAGPFRNRAHSGIYMHTAFWLVLMRANWPKRKAWEAWLTYPTIAMTLYVISSSGRRSIYIAIAGGLLMLAALSVLAGGKARLRIGILILVTLGAVGIVYYKVADFWKPAAFFKDRIVMVDERIATFSGRPGEGENPFVIEQRKAALKAFREHPILGIGYGGFWRWEGNPTRHEMHSTPTRFLAEMGIIGVILYTWWMIEIAVMAVKIWWRSRGGAYEAASILMLVGLTSVSVSAIYNRQMTDRTFWLILVIGIALEAWTTKWARPGQRRIRSSIGQRPVYSLK